MSIANLCIFLPLGLGLLLSVATLLSMLSNDVYSKYTDPVTGGEIATRLLIIALPLIMGIALIVKALS